MEEITESESSLPNSAEVCLKESSTIKHIVIAGGGVFLFSSYGALKELNQQGIWNFENIETLYGTSSGAINALILNLNFDWETMDNFLINRPWQHVFKMDM